MTDTSTTALVRVPDGPFELQTGPRRSPGSGEVLVQIAAAALNPLDAKIRAGAAAHAKQPLPAVLGLDMAGTVLSAGHGVTGLRAGDKVYGMVGGVGGLQGTLATHVVADAALLAIAPSALGWRDTAALPLASITAWEGLVDRAKVGAGDKVLIQGGAGGVGSIAIQLARTLGAEVYATARPDKHDLLRRLGAEPIELSAESIRQAVERYTGGRGFDVIYDTLGGGVLDASFGAVNRYDGHVVSCLGWGQHSLAPLSFRGATYSGVFTLHPLLSGEGRAHHGKILTRIAALADRGLLKPRLDPSLFGLGDLEAAFAHLTSGAAAGRVVVDIEVS